MSLSLEEIKIKAFKNTIRNGYFDRDGFDFTRFKSMALRSLDISDHESSEDLFNIAVSRGFFSGDLMVIYDNMINLLPTLAS